jgi:hypothetical protein
MSHQDFSAITLGYWLSAFIALAIIAIGTRFWLSPHSAAGAFGVPVGPDPASGAYLSAKGTRDIASGLFTAIFIVNGQPRLLACFLLVAAVIPLVDMLIVLRHGGSRLLAISVHGGTAVLLVGTSALLFL